MERCFDIHLWISFTPNAAVLFVDVAIQPEVRFIAKQNSLMKIGNNGNLVLGSFDESTPCLIIFKIYFFCIVAIILRSIVCILLKNNALTNTLINRGCTLLTSIQKIPVENTSSKVYNIWIRASIDHNPNIEKYCQSKVGARLVDCCAHVASVLWYWRHNHTHTQTKTPSLGYADTLQDAATGGSSDDSASESEKET
ncbi:adhesion G protein-coupled receptor B2 [Trichonephila clavipes]|nr:adhesion G protein-coupled receptor B2 [Trichonephila clavipes]